MILKKKKQRQWALFPPEWVCVCVYLNYGCKYIDWCRGVEKAPKYKSSTKWNDWRRISFSRQLTFARWKIVINIKYSFDLRKIFVYLSLTFFLQNYSSVLCPFENKYLKNKKNPFKLSSASFRLAGVRRTTCNAVLQIQTQLQYLRTWNSRMLLIGSVFAHQQTKSNRWAYTFSINIAGVAFSLHFLLLQLSLILNASQMFFMPIIVACINGISPSKSCSWCME